MADGSKRPLGTWKRYERQLPAEAEVRGWYQNGQTGLGVVCGAVSGGLEMLEFEGRAVAAGRWTDFCALAKETGLGPLVERVMSGYFERTPSGGIHLLYHVPHPKPNTKLASRPATAEELAENPADKVKGLLETRGEGGYTILAPSSGRVHPSGLPWKLVQGGFDTIASISDEERDALYDLARAFDESPPEPERPVRASTLDDGDRPGDRYNAAPDVTNRVLELLEQHGWTRVYSQGDAHYLRRPGKDTGISATLGRVAPGVLRVFSSSTEFEVRAHSAFAVFTKLAHGGDFRAAARELAPPITIHAPRETSAAPATRRDISDRSDRSWPAPPESAAYAGLAGDIVGFADPHTEADPVAVLVQAIIAFGCTVGRNPHVMVGATRHGANENAVIVGDTAKARKGDSWAPTRVLFALADPDWSDRRVVSGLGSGEAVVWSVRDPIERLEPVKESGRIVGHELVVVDPGEADKRLHVHEPELARVTRVIARQGSTLSPVLRDAWDGGQLRILTKNNPARATDAHISVVGHVTSEELRRELHDVEAFNGFANRFLWLVVRRSKFLPEPEPFEGPGVLVMAADIRQAIEWAAATGRLERDAAARQRWADVYPSLAQGRPGLLGAVLARAEAHVLRLSLLYALLDRSTVIGLPHLESALALWAYVERSAEYVFGNATGDPIGDTIADALAASDLTRTQIRDLFGRHESAGRIEAALGLLLSSGRARTYTQQTGGRPVETWARP